MCRVKITDVKFKENYRLVISLSNGHGIEYNLGPKIKTARFQTLQRKTLYQEGKLIADDVIGWSDGTELSLDEIVMNLTNQLPYRE